MLDLLLPRRPTPTRHAAEWTPASGRPGFSSSRVTRAGVIVNEDLALTYSAVFCASRIIAETESSLPLFLLERLAKDDRQPAIAEPLFDLLHSAPNPQIGSMAFREGRTLHQVNFGGGFAEIERERTGDLRSPVVALWPIHPSRVSPSRPGDRYANGGPIEVGNYLVRNNDGTTVTLRPEEMLHVPGVLSEDGIWGKSVVQYARESVGMGIAHVRSGATSFGSGNTPRVVLTLPGLKTDDKRREFRKEWKELYGSPDSGEIVILPVDGKLERLSFSQVDNQYVESGLLTIKDISRFWRVPLHMLMEMESGASRASIEQVGIEFITYSILPWLKRWEDQCSLKLLTRDQRGRFFIEHQLQGLLRGDTAARMEGYRQAIMMGLMTINECRRLENLNGIGPDGDIHYLPANLTTAERMREGPQLPEPEPEPGAIAGPGSDHTGSPAEPLTKAARQEIERQLQVIVQRNAGQMDAPTPVVLPSPVVLPAPKSAGEQPRDEAGRFDFGTGGEGGSYEASAFGSSDAAHAWAGEHANRGTGELSDSEKGATGDYRGYWHKAVNGSLRNPASGASADAKRSQEITDSLDGLCARGTTDATIVAKRGIADAKVEKQLEKAFLTGLPLIDNGFVSTSLDRETARGFTDGGHQVYINLKVPAGTHSYYHTNSGECELMVARGAKMVIENKREVDGKTHYDALLLGTGFQAAPSAKKGGKKASVMGAPGRQLAAKDDGKGGATEDDPDRFLWSDGDMQFAPGDDDDDGEQARMQAAIRLGAGAVLVDVLARTFRKEANAAGRAAKETRPGSFAGWLTEFYGKHREMVATALAPACEVVRAAGVAADPAVLAAALAAESVSLLRDAYETLTPAKLAEMLAAWPTDRAARTAEGILSGEYPHAATP